MDTQQLNNTYILLQRFRFPTGNTTKDAIAVTSHSGLILVSLYTLMIDFTILQVWSLVVSLSIFFFIRKAHSHNCAAATAGIFNAQSSPTSVVTLVVSYIKPMKQEIWYPILWIGLAMLAAGAASSASTLLPGLLHIGNAAPVNPSAVYVPNPATNGTALNTTVIGRIFALGVPGALRAAGQVGIEPKDNVMVEQETDASSGSVRVNYHYNITAAEFGLQNIPGLILYVNGSCYTEYGWFRGTISDNASTTDVYHLWNDPNYLEQPSTSDGGPPFPLFKSNRTSGPILGNNSYAIVISSLDRFSYTSGTDPWYLTIPYNISDSPYPYIVDTGRPALSCWETNIFHYHDKISNVWNLNELHPAFGSSNSTPSFLADVLQLSLNEPMITLIGTRLGRSALASSSSSALGVAFDANTSSIYRDLEYLAVASYITTRDIFAETTRFNEQGREGILDLARDNGDKPRSQTGDFVITSPNIATLSIRALIIVPAVTGGMVLVVFLFKRVSRSWNMSRALGATMLYSYLHELAGREGGESESWNREGDVAFSSQKAPARIMPVAGLHEKGVLWNLQSKGEDRLAR